MQLSIRVQAKTEADQYRSITVPADGSSPYCDCGGFDGEFCSHIDAVLLACERAMVHPDDVWAADLASEAVAGRLVIPDNWKGAWRQNLRWRGLSSRGPVRRRRRDEAKPVVCFTGAFGSSRSDMIAEAITNGWEFVDSPSPSTDVLVAADPASNSRKLQAARKNRTPIITLEQWRSLMTDGVLE